MNFDPNTTSASSANVTVVMPVYNHARYVVEAIESVRNQTYSKWRLIVIDDGSTDDTVTVLNRYLLDVADPRIEFFQQANAGSHATLNRGLNMGFSQYLAVLNSDDRYASDRLEKLVSVGDLHHGEVFITTGVSLVDENGVAAGADHWWNGMYQGMVKRWSDLHGQCENPSVQTLMWGNFTVSTSNFFLSRTLWQALGPFKHLRYVPDWDLALRAAADHPDSFIFLPEEKLLDYRLHGQNTILGGALRNHAEAFRMLRVFQKKWVDNGKPITGRAVDRLHYLSRFIRHEHARQQMERQATGWIEQVEALRAALDRRNAESERLQQQAARLTERLDLTESNLGEARAQRDYYQKETARLQEEADTSRDETALARQETFAIRHQANALQQQLDLIHASRSWRLTAPLRRFNKRVQSTSRMAQDAPGKVVNKILSEIRGTTSYDQWLAGEAAMLVKLNEQSANILLSMSSKPLISVVMPVHNAPPAFLQAAVDSVKAQWYPLWELCICDDGSTRAETPDLINQLCGSDIRIKMIRRVDPGHIAIASNDAIGIATGQYVVFLDHDDQLPPHALLRLAQSVNARPDLDFIYSDEDKLDAAGNRCLPFFKPDWSPVLLWSQNYIGHLMCVRRSLLTQLGGFRQGTQGSQDHDLVLRIAASGAKIEHLPEVLYHWQMHEGSTSASADAKPYAHLAGKDAVSHHLAGRYGQQFDQVDDSAYTFVYKPRFKVPPQTLASIIIPTRDHAQLLQDCIDSIFKLTVGIRFEIIILDNRSQEAATKTLFRELATQGRASTIAADLPFNWSLLNNIGRKSAKGEVLVFLNNDTQVISPDWLLRLAEHALLPDVATVGPMLLYPDGTIQHAGVVVGMGGWADHVFKGAAVTHFPSPFVSSVVPRNVLANTGACVAIATSRFDELGGFDEAFEICGSDVELGIRAHNRGYQNVYLPDVQLYHLESKTRSASVPQNDFEQSSLKYAPYRIQGDPFYNPNLDPFSVNPVPRTPSPANQGVD